MYKCEKCGTEFELKSLTNIWCERSLDSDKQDLYVCEECYYKLYDGDPTIEGQRQKLQKETRHLDPIIRGVTALYLYPFACTHPEVKNRIISILQVALNDPDADVRATAALSLELIEQKPEFDRPSTKFRAIQEAIKWRKKADYSLKDVYKMQFPVDSRITEIKFRPFSFQKRMKHAF